MKELKRFINRQFKIEDHIIDYCCETEESLKDIFDSINSIAEYNQLKVLKAMQKNRLSEIHFAATTGYGYNDLGRDVIEQIYADVFNADSGLVRPQIISGTHALTTALFGNLRPGDQILSPVGKPYDTLAGVIGITPQRGSLAEYGIEYRQVDLMPDGKIDYESIKQTINSKTKLVLIQRSKGYTWRNSLSIEEIQELIEFIKKIRNNIICMVDNCYGEFVDIKEPTDVGADLTVGSLIKNIGGGLAPVGGYIVGLKEYVDNAAIRLTAPGLGKEVGPTLGLNASFAQGLFLAPQIVAGSLKGAVFAAKAFEQMGFEVLPTYKAKRSDIVQAIKLRTPEGIITFCKAIQQSAPVDSFLQPEPENMPGYDNKIIMAAGTFVSGSSIELSADAPIRPPYIVYLQGGLSWHHAKIGIMTAIQALQNKTFPR